MKFMKYLISVLVSLILSINIAIAEKWDMALAYGAGNFHSANATKFAAIEPTITALSAVRIIVIKIIFVKITSSSIKI